MQERANIMGGDVIDSLSIELKSNSTNANRAVDNLISKLGALQTALAGVKGNGGALTGIGSGIKQLGQGMKSLEGVNQSKFNSLANGINKLTAIDVAGLNRSASAIRQVSNAFNGIGQAIGNLAPISDLTKSLGKLGGKSVTTAITNIPMLAKAMNGLLTTLSKAPKVSNNVVSMTNALARLASQGQKTSSATKGIRNAFNATGNSTMLLQGRVRSLASIFGTLNANFFWVRRAIYGIRDAVRASMDYIETLNYFDAAFGQVASKAVDGWKEAGYKSAEAYYNSFSKRAKKVTEQMSGYKVSKTGTLDYTGGTTLGIEPNKLMNYQATYGQMASSIGIGAENSLKMSRALTEIGADLASVKNMDFDKTWKDMASGLAGMSRTLDKYGVNIRLVNLQQKLSEIGIEANIQKLNQNEKALLRTIILLDSTKYAWGDLAETINQPANQVRLLKANFQNLTRTIGNLFLPAVAAVLPYINALTIALQRMFNWIGKSLGIDISKLTSGVADSEFDMSELADSTDDVADALDDADKSAKKLKKTTSTIGIDKLNIISKDKDTTDTKKKSKGLDAKGLNQLNDAFEKAYERYQKAWDKAFNSVDNKAQRIAGKIVKVFKEGDFEGIGSYIGDKLTKGLQSIPWGKIYKLASNFGTGFAQFLNGLISPELFGEVGKTIASSLNTAIYLALGFLTTFDFSKYGKSIASGISNFFRTFDFKSLAEVINRWADGLFTIVENVILNMDWIAIIKGAFNFLTELKPSTVVILILARRFMLLRKEMGLLKATGLLTGKMLSNIATGISSVSKSIMANGLVGTVKNLGTNLRNLGSNMSTFTKVAIGVGSVVLTFQQVNKSVKGLYNGTEDLISAIVKIGVVAGIAGVAMYAAFGPAGVALVAVAGLLGVLQGISAAQEEEMENIKKLTPEEQKHADAVKKSAEAYKELSDSRKDRFDKINMEYDSAKSYAKELDKIVDKNGKIKKGYEDRANVIIYEINEALGTEYKIVDGQIKKYKELEKQVKKTIEQKRINVLLDSGKEDYTEAKTNIRDKQHEMEDLQKDYDNQEEKVRKASEKYNSLVKKYAKDPMNGTLGTRVSRAYYALEAEKEKLSNIGNDLEKAQEVYTGYLAIIDNYENAISASVNGTSKEMENASIKLSNNFISSATGTVDELLEQSKRYKEQYLKDMKDLSNGVSGVTEETVKESKYLYEQSVAELAPMLNKSIEETLAVLDSKTLDTFKNIGEIFTEAVVSGFSAEKIKEGLKTMMKAGMSGLTGIFSIDSKVLGVDTNGTGGKLAGKIKANNPFNTQKYQIGTNLQFKANGGFVDEGQMFVAREAGPELVGNIGSKTGVINNDQIVRSVSNGVASAVANVLVGSDFDSSKDDRPIIIQINGREVARAVNEENKRKGSTMLGYGNGY